MTWRWADTGANTVTCHNLQTPFLFTVFLGSSSSASAWRTPIHLSRTHSDKNSVAFLWLPLPRIELVAPNLCVVTGAPAFTGLNSPDSSLDLRNLPFCLELGMHVGIWLRYWTACFISYHDSISHTGKWRFRDSFTCSKSHSRHNIKRTQAHFFPLYQHWPSVCGVPGGMWSNFRAFGFPFVFLVKLSLGGADFCLLQETGCSFSCCKALCDITLWPRTQSLMSERPKFESQLFHLLAVWL